jgi:hypothetical protein
MKTIYTQEKFKMKFISLKAFHSAIICLCIFLSVILSSCKLGFTSWEENKTVHGIEFEKIRYGLKDNDTTSIIGFLKTNTLIEQYPCAADWIHFSKDWKLRLFRLNSKATINNFEYCKNCWIRFVEDGSIICVFPENTTVQGYNCIGGGGASGVSTSFYKNGRLHYFFSDETVLIGGILCKSNLLNNIGLYENGKLKECTLAQDQNIDNSQYRKNTRICFDETGKVKAIL